MSLCPEVNFNECISSTAHPDSFFRRWCRIFSDLDGLQTENNTSAGAAMLTGSGLTFTTRRWPNQQQWQLPVRKNLSVLVKWLKSNSWGLVTPGRLQQHSLEPAGDAVYPAVRQLPQQSDFWCACIDVSCGDRRRGWGIHRGNSGS